MPCNHHQIVLDAMPLGTRTALAADRSREEPGLARRCAQLTHPVLILHGAEDPRPVWATDSLAQALPNARRALINNAGHLPWLEQPQAIAEEIRGHRHATKAR